MSDDEMTEAESAAFLRDLESRAKSKPAAAMEDDGEDIEEYLKRLEAEDAKTAAAKPKTKVKDPFEDEFAALNEAPVAEMVKAPEPEKPVKEEKAKEAKKEKKGKKDVRAVERGSSEGLKRAKQVLKWALVLAPSLVAIWLVGAFVSQWVSAGWLVAVVALVGVLGVPGALRASTGKGSFVWWLAGFSILACVGLTVPMNKLAPKVVVNYGHWPASVLASAAGWDVDHFTVRSSQWVSEKLAGLVDPLVLGVGLRLGTDVPLVPTEPVVAPVEGEPVVPPGAPVAEPVAPVTEPVAAPVAPVAAPVAPVAEPIVAPEGAAVEPAPGLQPSAPAVAPAP